VVIETPGEFISRRLKELGLTQKRLAEVCGVCQPQISCYVRGIKAPDIESLRVLCAVLGPYEIRAERPAIVLR